MPHQAPELFSQGLKSVGKLLSVVHLHEVGQVSLLPAAPARGIPVEGTDQQHCGRLRCLDDGDCCAKQGFEFLLAGRDKLPNDVVPPTSLGKTEARG